MGYPHFDRPPAPHLCFHAAHPTLRLAGAPEGAEQCAGEDVIFTEAKDGGDPLDEQDVIRAQHLLRGRHACWGDDR